MSITLKKFNQQEYTIFKNNQSLGNIKLYTNSFHTQNCYLQLNLNSYDIAIAAELFNLLSNEINKPLQVMTSSEDRELIIFLENGGFKCKRRCYEMEISPENYIAEAYKKVNLQYCMQGSAEYDMCCQLMYHYYSKTHESINPLTVDYSTFTERLPKQAIYLYKNENIVSVAFVEENEIAYVASNEVADFKDFIRTVVEDMFEKHEDICFECDDCDEAAMELRSLFESDTYDSYNTYVKE